MAKKRSHTDALGSFTEIITNVRAIGPIIQNRRKAKGYTQESLAEALDVNVNTIKYIEQGRRAPSIPMLLKIAKLIKIQLILESK